MLRWLASISPIAVLLAGALPAGAIGWFAHGTKFAVVDRPQIIREATARADDACAIRSLDAARRAEAAERERQRAASADALRLYKQALANSERRAAEADARLEQEIVDYETQLNQQGRSCRLTGPDIDWLHGRQPPGADSGR